LRSKQRVYGLLRPDHVVFGAGLRDRDEFPEQVRPFGRSDPRPVFFRSDFVAGLLSPSDDGGLLEFFSAPPGPPDPRPAPAGPPPAPRHPLPAPTTPRSRRPARPATSAAARSPCATGEHHQADQAY
jgi:hypothetical protein